MWKERSHLDALGEGIGGDMKLETVDSERGKNNYIEPFNEGQKTLNLKQGLFIPVRRLKYCVLGKWRALGSGR